MCCLSDHPITGFLGASACSDRRPRTKLVISSRLSAQPSWATPSHPEPQFQISRVQVSHKHQDKVSSPYDMPPKKLSAMMPAKRPLGTCTPALGGQEKSRKDSVSRVHDVMMHDGRLGERYPQQNPPAKNDMEAAGWPEMASWVFLTCLPEAARKKRCHSNWIALRTPANWPLPLDLTPPDRPSLVLVACTGRCWTWGVGFGGGGHPGLGTLC